MDQSPNTTTVPATFNGLAIGKTTARIGVRILRSDITLSTADRHFTNSRLDILLEPAPPGESNRKQMYFGGIIPKPMGSVVDVKGMTVTEEAISIGLTFARKEISPDSLARYATAVGRFTFNRIGEAGADASDVGEDEHGTGAAEAA